ncbi:MAG: diaminobutyrate acetyltransferase [Pseudohongiella sp.]|nr:diaminobutyrate acetyltransferase [Pseudohongiella sp.]
MSMFQEAPALQERPNTHHQILIRQPAPDDGIAVHNLIRKSAFLDDNSLYCYLVLCTHFSETSVIATLGDDLAGVVTAYIPPQQPDTLFVWQVAVDTAAQGRGLASSMLNHILERDTMRRINYVETTVTADNHASRAMFMSLARRYKAQVAESVMFDRDKHFLNLHDSEHKLRIGPLTR